MYCLCNDNNIRKILARKWIETGGVTWNGDDEYFKDVGCEDTLSDSLGVVEEPSETLVSAERIENIAVQTLNIICDTIEG